LVDELIQLRGTDTPPFLAEEFAPLRNISKIERIDLGDLDGVLVRSRDGYVMKINAKHHPLRQNFSCAHEIGHTLLDELLSHIPLEDNEYRGGSAISKRDKERLCDRAAAELLMPGHIFGDYLHKLKLSIESIEVLSNIFKVSMPATAIRVQELSKERCRIITWKRWIRSKSEGFFQYKTKQPACYTYVRDPSALLKAYQSNESVRSYKLLEIDKVSKRYLIESKAFGNSENRYVLSLVFLDR
jgi:Zn-dependent peptidase ImmA (M78 family)